MRLLQNTVLLIILPLILYIYGSAGSLYGQITSSGFDSVVRTEYSIEAGDTSIHDIVYIFCGTPGNLTATSPDGTDMTFEWSLYDPSVAGFSIPLQTFTGKDSQMNDLESDGYQVRISGNGTDTTFRAWIFVNDPEVSVSVIRHDCNVLDLSGKVDTTVFVYYDPFGNDPYTLAGESRFVWHADPFISISSSSLDPRIWSPPPVVTTYTLTARYHSCEAGGSVSVDPLTTKAGFELNPPEGEAPLEVYFDAASSLNAAEYHWYFDYRGDSSESQPDATGINPEYTYYIPGEYEVTLRTVNGLCDDWFTLSERVRVYPSELEVPNVFSPGGSGYNDTFMVRAVSMRDFHGIIYNRDGRKIFEWTDPATGWDGTAGNNREASPGVYFYDIRGTGWDDREYELGGPLYLFRNR